MEGWRPGGTAGWVRSGRPGRASTGTAAFQARVLRLTEDKAARETDRLEREPVVCRKRSSATAETSATVSSSRRMASEQGQQFRRRAAGAADPVRFTGVEPPPHRDGGADPAGQGEAHHKPSGSTCARPHRTARPSSSRSRAGASAPSARGAKPQAGVGIEPCLSRDAWALPALRLLACSTRDAGFGPTVLSNSITPECTWNCLTSLSKGIVAVMESLDPDDDAVLVEVDQHRVGQLDGPIHLAGRQGDVAGVGLLVELDPHHGISGHHAHPSTQRT